MAGFIVLVASAALTIALNSTAPTPAYGPQPEKVPDAAIPATQSREAGPATVPPGTVLSASYRSHSVNDAQEGRNFVCADSKCKTTTPVYNTRTPIETERGRLAKD